MNMLLILPILIPFATALSLLFAIRHRKRQRVISACGAGSLTVAAVLLIRSVWIEGILAVQMGNWPAPFGITLVADMLSALMVLMAAIIGLVVAIYSLTDMDPGRERHGYYPLLHFLLMGVCGAFLTGDIFNLYVWFEVMLIASFVLMCLGGERAQLEGSIKYVTLNLVSSALFLAAVGLVYGMVGTLNMADVALQMNETQRPVLMRILAVLFMLAFGIKAAIFPLFFWLPASYHTPPVSVTALFAGMLTKVGVYALIRFFTLMFDEDQEFTRTLILILSGFTMVTGVLGAVAQYEFRRLLSFHIVSQIGYMTMGLGLMSPLALAGAIFFMIHNIIVKTNLFLISGIVARRMGSYQFSNLGGLYAKQPVLSILFLISAMSLAGVPPLSGFWGKLLLARAGFETEHFFIVAVSLTVGLLTLFSMTKIWNEVFWKPAPQADMARELTEGAMPRRGAWTTWTPVVLLTALALFMGLAGQLVYVLTERAAGQLLNPAAYIQAVLGVPS